MRPLLAILISLTLSLNGWGATVMAVQAPTEHADASMDHDCGAPCDCRGDEAPAGMTCQAACVSPVSLAVLATVLATPMLTATRRRRPALVRLSARAPDPPRRPPRLLF